MIGLYFLIPEVIAQIFTPTAELAIYTRKPSDEANVEIETQTLTTETKKRKS